MRRKKGGAGTAQEGSGWQLRSLGGARCCRDRALVQDESIDQNRGRAACLPFYIARPSPSARRGACVGYYLRSSRRGSHQKSCKASPLRAARKCRKLTICLGRQTETAPKASRPRPRRGWTCRAQGPHNADNVTTRGIGGDGLSIYRFGRRRYCTVRMTQRELPLYYSRPGPAHAQPASASGKRETEGGEIEQIQKKIMVCNIFLRASSPDSSVGRAMDCRR